MSVYLDIMNNKNKKLLDSYKMGFDRQEKEKYDNKKI